MASVTPKEAAGILGFSLSTIKRKLRTGELAGHKTSSDRGEIWLVDLPDEEEGMERERQEIGPENVGDAANLLGLGESTEQQDIHSEDIGAGTPLGLDESTGPEVTPEEAEGEASSVISPGAGMTLEGDVRIEQVAPVQHIAPEEEPLEEETAEETLTCGICSNPIDEGAAFIGSAYGPVHIEPCSHQSKSL